MDTKETTDLVDRNLRPWGPTAIRYIAALLWLSNITWKVPPSFGQSADGCNRLCGYVADGIAHPVFPGSAWFFEHVVQPNLSAFGWYTLAIEGTLIVLLLSGRYLRVAGVLGIIQSIGIMSAVANKPGEWYWSYILMAALSFTIILFAPVLRPTPAKVMAVLVAVYGALVAIVFGGSDITAINGPPRVPFGGDAARNFAGNALPGSVALGLVLIAVGVIAWLLAERASDDIRRVIGWVVVAFGVLMLVTYRSGGTIIELGSKAATASVVAALGLSLVPSPGDTGPSDPTDTEDPVTTDAA